MELEIKRTELISLKCLIEFIDSHTTSETIASKECKELLNKLKELQ